MLDFTVHAETMMHERGILDEWVMDTVSSPDKTEERRDDEKHYLKKIRSAGGKTLRVVINPLKDPPRVITAFFDRRIKV
ncbi:MAG TPA: DUF4258 domain-containing protein [Methanoregulaceae archaeon]|nr:DUF4258 domain-containing protein [Methanoregulaceae archaeon]